jgi:hypothetical protein
MTRVREANRANAKTDSFPQYRPSFDPGLSWPGLGGDLQRD